jgi:hypothetical protein
MDGIYREKLRKAITTDFISEGDLIMGLDAKDIKFEPIKGNTYEQNIFSHINQTIAQGDIAVKKFLSALHEARPHTEIYRSGIQEIEPYYILDIVIIAMTKREAVDLPDQLGEDCELFNNLQEVIPFWEMCLNEHYGEKREDWKPYGKDAETIENIFNDGISKINKDRIKKALKEIKLQYSDESYFQDEEESRDKIWEILRQRGCILVIDSFSLFHPQLPKYIKDAEIITQDKTNIIILHGDMASAKQMNLWIEKLLQQYLERPKIFQRFNGNDHRCDIGIRDKRNLHRWLHSVVSAVFDRGEMPDSMIEMNDSEYPKLLGKN